MSPALAGTFFTTEPPGKLPTYFYPSTNELFTHCLTRISNISYNYFQHFKNTFHSFLCLSSPWSICITNSYRAYLLVENSCKYTLIYLGMKLLVHIEGSASKDNFIRLSIVFKDICTPAGCENSYCLIYLVTHQYSMTSVFFGLLAFLWSLMMLSIFFMFICQVDIVYCSIFVLNYLSFWKTFYIFKTQALWLWCVQSNVLPLLWLL